jgi:hypothetical protein
MSGTDIRHLNDEPFHAAMHREVDLGGLPYRYDEWSSGSVSSSTIIPSHLPVAPFEAENQALSRAYANLRNQRSQFQGIVSLGELSETIRLLKHPLKGVETFMRTYLRDLQKSKSFEVLKNRRTTRNRKDLLSTAADLWLEVAFGIRPLISDVKDLAGAILQQTHGSHRAVVVGTGFSKSAMDSVIPNELIGNWLQLAVRQRVTTTESVRFKVYIDTSQFPALGSLSSLQDSLGFNLESFVPSAYNLIPWSFLVDYMSNLGDVIEAGATSQSEVKFVVRTDRLETVAVSYYQPILDPTADSLLQLVLDEATPGSSTVLSRNVSRSTSDKLGMPVLVANLPGSLNKYGNILALLKANESSILSVFRRK